MWSDFFDGEPGTDVVMRRFSGTGQPLGDATVANLPASGRREDPKIVAGALGGRIVTWRDDDAHRFLARAFDPEGQPRTGELVLGEFAAGETPRFALAAGPGDGFTAVWESGPSDLLVSRFDDAGQVLGRFTVAGSPGRPGTLPARSPALAVTALGRLALAWTEPRAGSPAAETDVAVRLFAGNGTPLSDRATAQRAGESGDAPAVAAATDGGFFVVWRGTSSSPGRVLLRSFGADGQPRSAEVIAGDGQGAVARVSVAALPGSRAAVVWEGSAGPAVPGDDQGISAHLFFADGTPEGSVVAVARTRAGAFRDPVAVAGAGGRLAVVWWAQPPPIPILPPACSLSAGIFASVLPAACGGSGELCLDHDRFRLSVAWDDPQSGAAGTGHPLPVTGDTGGFWFFDPANVELVVKVLDGRAINGHFWVFYGSLSDVHFTLSVTDTETDRTRTYENPAHHLASSADTEAFDEPPPPAPVRLDPAGSFTAGPPGGRLAPKTRAAGPCSPPQPPIVPEPGLCLGDGRFEVEVAWTDPFHGTSGSATGVPLSAETGYLWFFSPTNLELVVKVLDGRAINGHFWVFYGSLTNVAYELTVHDNRTGHAATFDNPPFAFASRADIEALPDP